MDDDQRRGLAALWDDANANVGNASPDSCEDRGDRFDPRRFAAALDARALLFSALAAGDGLSPWQLAAAGSAAILDQEHAARVRFAAGLPTLQPKTEQVLLHLHEAMCQKCGRPWQTGLDGACPACPRIRWGHPDVDPGTWKTMEPADLASSSEDADW